MTFARVVFVIAGAFGAIACVGLYFAPGSPTYYGLIAGVVAWQVAFFIIASDPGRYRPLMIPAVVEKMVWVLTLAVLYTRGAMTTRAMASGIIPHGLLGLLFVAAFVRTPRNGDDT